MDSTPDSGSRQPTATTDHISSHVDATRNDGNHPDGRHDEPDWPALRLEGLPAVEPFPVDVLPDPVTRFVNTVSDAIGCPPDFVALPVLVVAGAALGRSVTLLLRPGHHVTAALYGMNVGAPSSGKSPALDAATRPLWQIQEELKADYLLNKRAYDLAMESYKAASLDAKPELPVKPTRESTIVNDTTTEALIRQLGINPRGLLASFDEGSGWVDSFGQYKNGQGTDRQFWLSALFGKPIRVDRKGNPDQEPFEVSDPFVSVIGNLPPDMLSALREGKGRSDGLMERVLFAVPDSLARRHWSEEGVATVVSEGWSRTVRRLRAVSMAVGDGGNSSPRTVLLSDEAKATWVAAYDAHVDDLNSSWSNPAEHASEGKIADFAARFALILHILGLATHPRGFERGPIPPVSRSAVEGAIRLRDYFRSQWRRVRALMAGRGSGGMPQGARLILNWIRYRSDCDQFSQSDLSRNYPPTRNYDPAEFENGLQWLAERHAIRRRPEPDRPKGKPGRRPAPVWQIHPKLRDRLDNRGFRAELRLNHEVCASPDSPASPATLAIGDTRPSKFATESDSGETSAA